MFAMDYALVTDSDRFRAEDEGARSARLARSGRPGRFEQVIRSMGHGLLRMVEKADLESRPGI
jgi:hypothetical protein